MSQVIHNTQHEFWRPPLVQEPAAAAPALVEVCEGCGAEFMIGARFCHTCGSARLAQSQSGSGVSWMRYFAFLQALDFQNVQRWFGLPLPSLIAFLVGIACLIVALLVGLVYSVQTFQDFQAIQLWRMQWILGSVAAFVAGILLKGRKASEK
jgi:hypothetical protein